MHLKVCALSYIGIYAIHKRVVSIIRMNKAKISR